MKYRSRSEIIALLLNAANGGGATKTKLMYSAFISFNQLREYLSLMVENGLINTKKACTLTGRLRRACVYCTYKIKLMK